MRRVATTAPQTAFVILRTSGFLVGALGVRHVAPMTPLAWRFVIAATMLSGLAIATRAPWPRAKVQVAQLALTGTTLNVVPLGCAYCDVYSLGVTGSLAAPLLADPPRVTSGRETEATRRFT